jgi:hypothetical protein
MIAIPAAFRIERDDEDVGAVEGSGVANPPPEAEKRPQALVLSR